MKNLISLTVFAAIIGLSQISFAEHGPQKWETISDCWNSKDYDLLRVLIQENITSHEIWATVSMSEDLVMEPVETHDVFVNAYSANNGGFIYLADGLWVFVGPDGEAQLTTQVFADSIENMSLVCH